MTLKKIFNIKFLLVSSILLVLSIISYTVINNVIEVRNSFTNLKIRKDNIINGFSDIAYQILINDNDLFVINAAKANNLENDILDLHKIEIKPLESNIDFNLEADLCIFDQKAKKLLINKNVKFNYFDNKAQTENFLIALKENLILFPKKLHITHPEFNLTSQEAEINYKIKLLNFAKNVEYISKIKKEEFYADIVEGDSEDSSLFFAENFNIIQDSNNLTGKKLTLKLDKNHEIKLITAKENIKFTNIDIEITSNNMKYDRNNHEIEFSDNVILTNIDGKAFGDRLIYDLKNQDARFIGDDKKQNIIIKIDLKENNE